MFKNFLRKIMTLGAICACALAMDVNSAFARDLYVGEADGLALYVIEENMSVGDQKYRSDVKIVENSTGEYEIADVFVKMSGRGYVISFNGGPFEPIQPGSVDDALRKFFLRIASNVGTAP